MFAWQSFLLKLRESSVSRGRPSESATEQSFTRGMIMRLSRLLKFSSPNLESQYLDYSAKRSLPVSRGFFLLESLYISAYLTNFWAKAWAHHAASPDNSVCSSEFRPWCIFRDTGTALMLVGVVVCLVSSTACFAAMQLAPHIYVRHHGSGLVVSRFLPAMIGNALMQVATCTFGVPGKSSKEIHLHNLYTGIRFIATSTPLALAMPCCISSMLISGILHATMIAPLPVGGDSSRSRYWGGLVAIMLVDLVLPSAVLYILEKWQRVKFLIRVDLHDEHQVFKLPSKQARLVDGSTQSGSIDCPRLNSNAVDEASSPMQSTGAHVEPAHPVQHVQLAAAASEIGAQRGQLVNIEREVDETGQQLSPRFPLVAPVSPGESSAPTASLPGSTRPPSCLGLHCTAAAPAGSNPRPSMYRSAFRHRLISLKLTLPEGARGVAGVHQIVHSNVRDALTTNYLESTTSAASQRRPSAFITNVVVFSGCNWYLFQAQMPAVEDVNEQQQGDDPLGQGFQQDLLSALPDGSQVLMLTTGGWEHSPATAQPAHLLSDLQESSTSDSIADQNEYSHQTWFCLSPVALPFNEGSSSSSAFTVGNNDNSGISSHISATGAANINTCSDPSRCRTGSINHQPTVNLYSRISHMQWLQHQHIKELRVVVVENGGNLEPQAMIPNNAVILDQQWQLDELLEQAVEDPSLNLQLTFPHEVCQAECVKWLNVMVVAKSKEVQVDVEGSAHQGTPRCGGEGGVPEEAGGYTNRTEEMVATRRTDVVSEEFPAPLESSSLQEQANQSTPGANSSQNAPEVILSCLPLPVFPRQVCQELQDLHKKMMQEGFDYAQAYQCMLHVLTDFLITLQCHSEHVFRAEASENIPHMEEAIDAVHYLAEYFKLHRLDACLTMLLKTVPREIRSVVEGLIHGAAVAIGEIPPAEIARAARPRTGADDDDTNVTGSTHTVAASSNFGPNTAPAGAVAVSPTVAPHVTDNRDSGDTSAPRGEQQRTMKYVRSHSQFWWFCSYGALLGWWDARLEHAYLKEFWARTHATCLVQALLDIAWYVMAGAHAAWTIYNTYSLSGQPSRSTLISTCLVLFAVAWLAYGGSLVWYARSYKHRGRGPLVVISDVMKAGCLLLCELGMASGLGNLAALFLNSQVSSAGYIGIWYVALLVVPGMLRIILHHLPPPYLLLHAIINVFILGHGTKSLDAVVDNEETAAAAARSSELSHAALGLRRFSPWMRAAAAVCIGVMVVVWQEACMRAKFLKTSAPKKEA